MNGTALPPSARSVANHERRRTDAVDVVVAVNENRFVFAERAHEPLDRPIEIEQADRQRGVDRAAAGDSVLASSGSPNPRIASRRQIARGSCSSRWSRSTAARSGSAGRIHRALGRTCGAAVVTPRKLLAASAANNHQSAAYNITPQPSQTSVPPVPIMMLRRCIGIAVSQLPQELPRSGEHGVHALARPNAIVLRRAARADTLRALSSRILRASPSSPSIRF